MTELFDDTAVIVVRRSAPEDIAPYVAIVRGLPDYSGEIFHAAVRRELRALGHGGLLIDHILDVLSGEGVELVEVKTQDRSANYPPYEATRGFWESHGFVYLDTIDPFPGWGPGNPAALYVCALRAPP